MNLIHAVFEPEGDGPHPTILALHGWGANALDLLGLAPVLARGEFQVICPQGPITVPLGPSPEYGHGYGWFPITMGAPPDPGQFSAAIGSLRTFIDAALTRYAIDRKKLVMLGFSQGGVVAYALALAQPERFAGLAALSSWLPAALAQQFSAAAHDRLPTLVQHGTRDELIDVARARESVEALRGLRVPVTYREYDMGHEINPSSLGDLVEWLQEKVLSPIVRI
ncbi:MAG: alpha/beta fold hydrolase [Deltaproteobacteria bacterium]|nr:alpha/beta fold hydrolase [Deltaproteobacteria bacterium]MBI3388816.1 alpha/beta fold hydrolase [Deltaproteobacteria bacterium]